MSASEVPLLGREHDVAKCEELIHAGHCIVLYGRVGVGKSALLHLLAQRARRRGMPCGFAPRTAALSDFTQALSRAYPGVPTEGAQRNLRGRLRMAVEARPGVVFLDGLGQTGTAFKGAVKSARGTGLGIVLAADTDQPRDRERLRALCLSHHEVELRPLHGNSMRMLLQAFFETRSLAGSITAEHLRALAAATDGLPGRAVDFADALVDSNAWSVGAPRVDWLRRGAAIRAAERYRQSALWM